VCSRRAACPTRRRADRAARANDARAARTGSRLSPGPAQELAGLEKSDLVEMVMAARQAKDDVEKRCVDLGQAFRHAQMSLQQLEEEVRYVGRASRRSAPCLRMPLPASRVALPCSASASLFPDAWA